MSESKSTSSTARATAAAVRPISEAATRAVDDYPELGELDGRFYLYRHLIGGGEIPDEVHADAFEELRVVAANNGWLPDESRDDDHVTHAVKTGDGWNIYYSVPVVPNSVIASDGS